MFETKLKFHLTKAIAVVQENCRDDVVLRTLR